MSDYTSEDEENWMRAALEDVTPASRREDLKKRLGSLLLTKASESFQRERRAASEARAKALEEAATRLEWVTGNIGGKRAADLVRALKTKGEG